MTSCPSVNHHIFFKIIHTCFNYYFLIEYLFSHLLTSEMVIKLLTWVIDCDPTKRGHD